MDNRNYGLGQDMAGSENLNMATESGESQGLTIDYQIKEIKEYIKNEKARNRKGKIISYIALALISALIGGLISPYIAMNYLYADKSPLVEEASDRVVYSIDDNSPKAITLAAKKAMGSVVGITTRQVQNYGFMSQEVNGLGSGVIVDKNGYILTNSHVIGDGNAKDITVLLEDGDKIPGQVLWNDSSIDLAIVKVDAKGLPVAALGNSDDLEIGETAIAIGNPLGLEFQRTVTSGIISGLHRSIQVDRYNVIEDLIQTDASINEGNSGGPLLNSEGEVVGINTAKIKTAEGLGFSIPINLAKTIISQVINEGDYKTVYIGITGMEIELYERQLGVELNEEKGIVVIQVVPNSPASNGDLRVGDIVTKIDDQEIQNMNQLKKSLYKYRKGDKAVLSIVRNGEEKQIEIVFDALK